MLRATKVLPAHEIEPSRVVDTVVLDADERYRRRVTMAANGGIKFLLDLPQAVMLKHGDGLLLDDGTIVRIAGQPEALVEIAAASEVERLRLAWHIGNRHTEVQVAGDRLRIRRDHVLEAMLRGLGAELTFIEAPFEPEAGAYGHGHAHHPDHEHTHDHDHGHGHDHGT